MQKFYTLLVLFLGISVSAQTGVIIDSLKSELNKKQADTITAQILNDLAYYYLYQDIDSSLIYGEKANNFATKINYHKVKAKSNLYLGNAFLFSDRYDSAQVYYEKSYKIFEDHDLDKSAIYSSLGMFYKAIGDYSKAIKMYYKGIAYDEGKQNEYGTFIKLNNLANVYGIIEDNKKSIALLNEAIIISKKSNNPNIKYALGTILNGIGSIYVKEKRWKEAILHFKRSLAANRASDNKKEIARNYHNLGSTYEKKNELRKSLQYLNMAFAIRKTLENKVELAETHFQLGTTNGKLQKKEEAEQQYKKGLSLAKELKNNSLIAEIHLAKSNTYSLWKDTKSALNSFKKHTVYRDSILTTEHLKSVSEIETKYETAKKDKEIVTQRLELEKTSFKLERRNTLLLFLLGAMVLLWLLFLQRQKRKNLEITTLKRDHQIKTLESLIQGEEKERFRIAKELHDGVNGDLSAIKFKLSSLLEKNNQVIQEAIIMIDDSCKQVRAISHNLIPPSLDNFNLVEALTEYCENMNATYKTEILFQHLGETVSISKNAEINIFRVAQELIINAIKHAQATLINVQISCRGNEIQLTIEDNGIGYDVHNEKEGGIGLDNINSRVNYLKAEKDIVSNNEGTSNTITMEIDKLP